MEKLVVGVRFRESGKVYYFDPGDIELKKDDTVIVSTVNGLDYGKIVLEPRNIPKELVEEEINPVIRKATDDDEQRRLYLKRLADEARQVFNSRVSEHDLNMKLIDVQYTFDEKKVIFFFTAEGRVDFRDLVKDLAGFFHARIELRQIGVRDEARKYASVGVCGRKCCCASWLSDFVPVSIKMAKEQNLSLNSTKISGICGRLLCCLTYEEAYYEELSKRMPSVGEQIKTPDGIGTVYKLRTLEEAVLVKILNEQEEIEIKRFTLEELDEAAKHPEVKPGQRKNQSSAKAQPGSRAQAYKDLVEEKKKEAERTSESKRPNSRIRKTSGNKNKRSRQKNKNTQQTQSHDKPAQGKKVRKRSKRRPLNTNQTRSTVVTKNQTKPSKKKTSKRRPQQTSKNKAKAQVRAK